MRRFMMGQVLQLLATALLQHRTPLRGAPSYHGRASQQEGLTQKEMVFQQGRASQQGGGDPKKGGRTSRGGRPSKGRSPRKESVLQQREGHAVPFVCIMLSLVLQRRAVPWGEECVWV